ncbi:MAG TPA: tetratricopeptide repeat protein, partial [Verrucomicrobiae bacterium]|nr:tetratricopeptide repeat protein [Verrucomicrobiae bacterium]
SHYRSALKCSEGCIEEAYFNLGGVLLAHRRYEEAIECYRKALNIDPKYGIAKKRLRDAELALRFKNS